MPYGYRWVNPDTPPEERKVWDEASIDEAFESGNFSQDDLTDITAGWDIKDEHLKIALESRHCDNMILRNIVRTTVLISVENQWAIYNHPEVDSGVIRILLNDPNVDVNLVNKILSEADKFKNRADEIRQLANRKLVVLSKLNSVL